MNINIRSLKIRIVIFFALLLQALQLGNGALLKTVGAATAKKALYQQLEQGEQIFNRLLEQNALKLLQGARILAADFAFRQALATGDRATVISALENHGARINADAMMLVDLDRKVIADTATRQHVGKSFAFRSLIANAEQRGSASAVVMIDGNLYQLVVVPVLAPTPIAWIALGFRINDGVVTDLKQLTGLQVSFLALQGTVWRMQASTLPTAERDGVASSIPASPTRNPFNMSMADIDDEYATLVSQQATGDEQNVIVALQSSLAEATAPFRELIRSITWLSVVAIGISILVSYLIARGIARPVEDLAAFARRIAAGDYSDPPPIKRGDEIGDLAEAFAHMRDGISTREARIMDLAYRDPLTGLPNRALFNDRLQQAVNAARRQSTSLAVLIVNLDDFRSVNDALGHPAGDLVLCEVAERLRQVIQRQTDTVARLGADEYAILMPGEGIPTAKTISERILRALETPLQIEQQPVDARASIGIAVYPDHASDAEILMTHTDIALSLAKRHNTGFTIFDSRYEERSIERLSLMGELRQAVERDELVMYYQPKIDLRGHQELHAEALVRWHHPNRGFIPPAEFIPFAEQTGYIKAVTLWVLDRSIAQCGAWRRDGISINFSINLSTRDLLNPELPQRLWEMLAGHTCRAEWLTLEITESAIIDDPAHALKNLDSLNRMGFRLAIDDFGTGYSSLSYLKRLPVDELKIDKSFVLGMNDNMNDRVIVQSTIDLAHNMGLNVVAEGVETVETLDALRLLGCDIAQGYLVSKPLPASEFVAWLHSQRPAAAA